MKDFLVLVGAVVVGTYVATWIVPRLPGPAKSA